MQVRIEVEFWEYYFSLTMISNMQVMILKVFLPHNAFVCPVNKIKYIGYVVDNSNLVITTNCMLTLPT